MKVYITRHGQDDDTVRGGWSDSTLTELGVKQAEKLGIELLSNIDYYNIGKVYSSDLLRAKQTAEIILSKINPDIIQFERALREVNNGDLAGMKNEMADIKYPNLYWRSLDWNQKYPNGESPSEFYNRIYNYFSDFIEENKNYGKNILIISHSGVINVIRSIVHNETYSNKNKYPSIPCCSMEFFIEV